MTQKHALTIGVMVDWINTRYHYGLVEAIKEQAAGHDINLLFFSGTTLGYHDVYHQYHRRIYDMLFEKPVDYLIIFPGVFEYISTEEALAFAQKASPISLITLCDYLPGYPCVLLDNKAGLQALLIHMIEKHRKKKLGMIKGLVHNYDSNERFDIFKTVMAQYGLPVDQKLLVEIKGGNWEGGYDAVRILLDERGLIPGRDFDCLVALNDLVAAGALTGLTQRGYRVPQDVALIGFDDDEQARCSSPSLSTVLQPNKKVAATAVQYIIDKKTHTDKIYIPTQMIIRESCGCQLTTIHEAVKSIDMVKLTFKKLLQDKETIFSIISSVIAPIADVYDYQTQLIAEFSAALLQFTADDDKEKLLAFFPKIYTTTIHMGQDINLWYKALSKLKIWLIQHFPGEPVIQHLLICLEMGNLMISSYTNKINLKENLDTDVLIEKLQQFEESMNQYHNFNQLLSSLSFNLNKLNFSSFYFFSYVNPEDTVKHFRLHLSVTNSKKDELVKQDFRDFRDVMEMLLSKVTPFTYCLLPITEENYIFGFIIVTMPEGQNSRILYENITAKISYSFKNKRLMQQIEDAYHKLEATQVELEKEMNVASKIQRSLSPATLSYPGFEMAAVMKTAISVGGDYYDFIVIGKRCWIIIGDVSGHGVHAGLIAMMVQTSIQLILRKEPDILLPDLLTRVNEVVTQNILKLGSLKYMTILIIAYHDDGKFIFSGMHLPLLIYRAQTGEVEIIETDGFWLGIIDNIDGFNSEESFSLTPGDTLLIYTDGIVEAVYKDNPSKMYDLSRLIKKFKEVGTQPAQAVINYLIKDLNAFNCDDDATLFVLKKL